MIILLDIVIYSPFLLFMRTAKRAAAIPCKPLTTMLNLQTISAVSAAPVSVDLLLSDIEGAAARAALRDIRAETEETETEEDENAEKLPWWCAPAEVR